MRFIYHFNEDDFTDIDIKIVVNNKINIFSLKHDCQETNLRLFLTVINEFSKSQITYVGLNRKDIIRLLQKCAIYQIEVKNENFKNLAKFRLFPNFFINDVFNNWNDLELSFEEFQTLFKLNNDPNIKDKVDIIEELFFRIKKAF